MTATPVVIDLSGAPETGAAWRGTIRDNALVLRPPGGGPERKVSLPRKLRMAELTAKQARRWAAVHGEVSRLVGGHHLRIVVDFDSDLRDLVRALRAWGLIQYSVYTAGAIGPIRPDHYPFLASADEVIFGDQDDERALSSSFAGGWLTGDPVSPGSPVDSPGPGSLRVLLVAYFAGACGAVGAKRVNYWASELAVESDSPLTVDVATAMPEGFAADARHHFVPDQGRAQLLTPFAQEPEWCSAAIDREVAQSKLFSTAGYYWRYGLEAYFDGRSDEFDVVVISGNPFTPFEFAAYAKRRWGAAVVLDYRDPFAHNPRMSYTDAARQEAAYVERGYNLASDVVTVVNDDCVGLVAGPSDVPVAIVPNGFDDRVLEPLVVEEPRPTDGPITIAHAGSFYADRSPSALIGALTPGRHRLIHVGPTAGIDVSGLAGTVVDALGALPYADAMAAIAGADLGLVYVTDSGFETPTKIYDYLGLGLEVLIVTTGPIRGGALGRVLDGVPGVHWVPNSQEQLRAFLADYEPGPRLDGPYRGQFSRREGTRRLLDQVQALVTER